MTLTATKFATRACGHRVPVGRAKCPYCVPPRLDAAPLVEVFNRRAEQVGFRVMSVEIATRLGMEYGRVERHIRRIVAGTITHVRLHTADAYCVALGGVLPASLWPDAWEDANPIEVYGDEDG
jgi:hypothetical protein